VTRGSLQGSDGDRDYTPAIYGSMLVTTLVAVQWHHDVVPELVAASLITAVAVFWLTHVWSELVNRRVRGSLQSATALSIARSEATMLTAAVLPAVILAMPRAIGMDADSAMSIALAVSIVQLFVWGLIVARVAGDSWLLSLRVASIVGGFGCAIVVIKVAILH
jgi:hypothetical protein